MPSPLPDLRSLCVRQSPSSTRSGVQAGFDLGMPGSPDLKRHALHEVYAASAADAAAADGFALALALRASTRPLVWIVEGRRRNEAGSPYATGLKAWGLAPADVLLVRVRDAPALLAAAEEALRSGAAGAVVMSGWGEHRAHDLTASRRLSLAASEGGTVAVLARAAAQPRPSAAETRWRVHAAPSTRLEAVDDDRAPGRPAFHVALTRSRGGFRPRQWIMEWDREQRSFVEPQTPGDLVSLPVGRPAGARAA